MLLKILIIDLHSHLLSEMGLFTLHNFCASCSRDELKVVFLFLCFLILTVLLINILKFIKSTVSAVRSERSAAIPEFVPFRFDDDVVRSS